MKKIIIITISIILLSCSGKSKSNNFENCDSIEHYHLSEEKEKKDEFWSGDAISENNGALEKILLREESINLEDKWIQNALKTYYIKETKNAKSSVEISKLFTDPKMEIANASFSTSLVTCAPVYRDILVFKKGGKVSAIAKVCFDCSQNILSTEFGVTRNTSLDYHNLAKLLKK